jgi:hypothetical protein
MKLHTYFNYGGNCEEGFHPYEKHLGGKILMVFRTTKLCQVAPARSPRAGNPKSCMLG